MAAAFALEGQSVYRRLFQKSSRLARRLLRALVGPGLLDSKRRFIEADCMRQKNQETKRR